ncbi:MAG: integrase core domain-containing protein [Patescibacteria group bacterium]
MRYFNTLKYGSRKLGKIRPLGSEGKARLAWFDEIHKLKNTGIRPNIRNLCQYKFGVPKSTFYRWKSKYNPYNLASLNNQRVGHKKGRIILPAVSIKLIAWKLNNPAKGHEYCWHWHKEYEQLLPCCPTTIYNLWKDKELLHLVSSKSKRKRKPFKKLCSKIPGYFQIDTKHLAKNRFQYTIKDLASRRRWLYCSDRISGQETIKVLEDFIRKVPFAILFIQFDNGLEFQKEVEEWLTKHKISWQHIWVREKDQNGAVESSHKTDEREFYPKFAPENHTLEEYRQALKRWEYEYNFVRLHSAIGWQTPEKYINNYLKKCPINS